MEKQYFIEFQQGVTGGPQAAKDAVCDLINEGYAPNTARFFGVTKSTKDIMGAIEALDDMGDPDSLKILNLVDRLLADDWTGCGVYEGLDELLKAAESKFSEKVANAVPLVGKPLTFDEVKDKLANATNVTVGSDSEL